MISLPYLFHCQFLKLNLYFLSNNLVLFHFYYSLNSFYQTPVLLLFQSLLLNPVHFQALIPTFSLNPIFPYFYLILAISNSCYSLSKYQYILKFPFHHLQLPINRLKSAQLSLLLYDLDSSIILLFTIQHMIPNYSYHHFLQLLTNCLKFKKSQSILSFCEVIVVGLVAAFQTYC